MHSCDALSGPQLVELQALLSFKPAVLEQLAAHCCRVAFANALVAADAIPDFIEHVVGWSARCGTIDGRITTPATRATRTWRSANGVIPTAFLLHFSFVSVFRYAAVRVALT